MLEQSSGEPPTSKVFLPLAALEAAAARLPLAEQRRIWPSFLNHPGREGQEAEWRGCLRRLAERTAAAMMDACAGEALEREDFAQGLALLHWCSEEGAPADALQLQWLQVVGRLHQWLVMEEAQGPGRTGWFWRGWELLHWLEESGSDDRPEWWEPVKEQLVRLGALAWMARAQAGDPTSEEGKLAITRALTLLQALGALHDPTPEWIDQAQLGLRSDPARPLRASLARHNDCQTTTELDQQATIRTIHHLACTGGTVISKCLAAMPGVALISEVNPLNRFGHIFEPTNPMLLLERSHRKLTTEEIKRDFLSQMGQVLDICHKDSVSLVIRDHSHTDFCTGDEQANITPIHDFLGEGYDLISILTVRHPLDSYLGLYEQKWHKQFSPSTLDEYSRRYHGFLDRYRSLPVRRYEDFCIDPQAFMEDLCSLLRLQYSPVFLERFGEIKLSGDSGRSDNHTITPRPRRPIPEDVAEELTTSPSYEALLHRLNYY